MMKLHFLFYICFLSIIQLKAQSVVASDKFNLPAIIKETSGLINYGNKLITHNDSGNAPELYEINTLNGSINRTVTITNATNVDWEDIGQDDTYIYIGDIGNNNGNRLDLKFYRILKTDFDSSTNVTADIINYSYANQTDFTSNPNNNDWDAEGFVIYGNHILIFSKNWVNNEVDVYALPNSIGTQSAIKVSNYNAQGLITGADIVGSNKIYLCGYSQDNGTPFLIEIYNLNVSTPSNLDVFANSDAVKLNNFLPFGNQVEGICFIETDGATDTLYISNEELSITTPILFTFPSKLRALTVDNSTLSTSGFEGDDNLKLYPNPFQNIIKLNNKADKIKIFDSLGNCVLEKDFTNTVNTSQLASGFYVISIKYKNSIIKKKILK
ncbi:T9SS type A sorting domain-containing protein [Litoribaculum gwangyangense]|uniref:Secretion system C-terminal sorting domain-containing protein n=1 Tax=Litoribaculum gwangyangense TaxID=1130722 RepID=A0ABP9CSE8_9FLAO